MDAIKSETWHRIPGHEDYEVSNAGRVRSWKVRGNTPRRSPRPRLLRPYFRYGTTYYNLDQVHTELVEIMRKTLGQDAARSTASDQERSLTPFEKSEILELEGIKDAYEVAIEFRLSPDRVRQLWDGVER